MTKTVIRISAVFASAAVIIMLLAAVMAAPAAFASADGLPEFSISADRTTADTGSQIVVSVAMDNDTTNTITSFSGDLQFDTRFFRYLGFEDQISMDGSVSIVADSASNGKLSFVYTGSELTNSRINCGDSVVFIKFIFSVITTYDTTGPFFVGTINDCYHDTVNLGMIDCKVQSITVRSTTASVATPSSTAPSNLSGDARLATLAIEGAALSPAFNSEFVAYSASVPYETASIRISATASSSGAIISGLGSKDLAVGMNNFTVTVLAENGTIREYGIIINRLEQIVTEPSTSATTTSTQDASQTTSSTENTMGTIPVITTYSQPDGSTTIGQPDEDAMTDDVLQIVGIVFGEIALFFFGFLSGFFVDKNLRRKGERVDYDDDYYEEDDYDDRGPVVYTPNEPVYPEGGYVDPSYQSVPQYADPQLIQYGQYGMDGSMMPEPVDPSFIAYPQGAVQPQAFDPQSAQFGQGQAMYPEEGFNGSYPDNPYYH